MSPDSFAQPLMGGTICIITEFAGREFRRREEIKDEQRTEVQSRLFYAAL